MKSVICVVAVLFTQLVSEALEKEPQAERLKERVEHEGLNEQPTHRGIDWADTPAAAGELAYTNANPATDMQYQLVMVPLDGKCNFYLN